MERLKESDMFEVNVKCLNREGCYKVVLLFGRDEEFGGLLLSGDVCVCVYARAQACSC